MQRYFVSPEQMDDKLVFITGEDVHHITRVMRLTVGDRFVCCDGRGRVCLVKLSKLEKGCVTAEIEEELNEERELPVRVTLAQSLPKGDKMDWVIQKGTELGAARFIPFCSERTIVQLNEKKEAKRAERWQKIAKEAAEQARRSRIPEIDRVRSWPELLREAANHELMLIAYEDEETTSLRDVFAEHKEIRSLLVLVGPEGGFSAAEVREAREAGFFPVSLGRRILRTETAGLYVLSCVSFYYER
ncbi:16S rRNA (uracil(1498)-N(3))-methyltransferase [Bacillaceae bacterium]